MLVWRGWGPMAIVAIFPLLASCGGAPVAGPSWIRMTFPTVALLLGGTACVFCGTRWNWYATEHSLYGIPLQAYGWLYLICSAVPALMLAVVGIVGKDRPERVPCAIAGASSLVALAVVIYLQKRQVRSYREGGGPPRPHDPEQWAGSEDEW